MASGCSSQRRVEPSGTLWVIREEEGNRAGRQFAHVEASRWLLASPFSGSLAGDLLLLNGSSPAGSAGGTGPRSWAARSHGEGDRAEVGAVEGLNVHRRLRRDIG